jgi:hypothetical protein
MFLLRILGKNKDSQKSLLFMKRRGEKQLSFHYYPSGLGMEAEEVKAIDALLMIPPWLWLKEWVNESEMNLDMH